MRSVLVVMVLAGGAEAGPLADAIAGGDVATLRGQLGDPAARCALGVVYAKRSDLPRAALYLAGCDDAQLPDDIAPDVARTSRDVGKKLEASELSRLEIDSVPVGLVAETTALPGEKFATPATVWVKAGSYEVRAETAGRVVVNRATVEVHSRGVVLLDTRVRAAPPPKDQHVDFADPTERTDGPPPAVKHKALLPKKYRGGVASADLGATDDPVEKPSNWIDDPLAIVHAPRPPLGQRLSLRAGPAAFLHRGGSTVEPEVAVEHHLVAPWEAAGEELPFELLARLDWSRRGSSDHAIDAFGAGVGVAKIVAAPELGRFGVSLGLHGQVRLADMLDGMPVSRFGLDATAGVELVMNQPFLLGLRVEQGLTELVPGARETAILFELGVEYRHIHR